MGRIMAPLRTRLPLPAIGVSRHHPVAAGEVRTITDVDVPAVVGECLA